MYLQTWPHRQRKSNNQNSQTKKKLKQKLLINTDRTKQMRNFQEVTTNIGNIFEFRSLINLMCKISRIMKQTHHSLVILNRLEPCKGKSCRWQWWDLGREFYSPFILSTTYFWASAYRQTSGHFHTPSPAANFLKKIPQPSLHQPMIRSRLYIA